MRGWWREIGDLVLPVACPGCGSPRTLLCAECGRLLYGDRPWRVRPSPEPAGLPVVYAAAPYEREVRAVLLAHKEQGAMGLAEPLGRALAGAVEAAVPRADARALLLVPVPSARRAVAARGHDAGRRIAFAAARELRRRGRSAQVVPVLRQRRAVVDQAGLSARGRLMNLSGALEVPVGGDRLLGGGGRGVPGRGGRVVLVDDLVTTGASLAEAARAVRAALGGDRGEESRAGYPPLVAAAVAASPARQGS